MAAKASTLISAFFLLPLNLILACAIGLVLPSKYLHVGRSLSIFALTLLAVVSTQAGALLLITPLEQFNVPLKSAISASAHAIVVLGGSGSNALHRARYAAQLQRETGLPVLVTGGDPSLLSNLQDDYRIPIKWVERQATNTEENAKFSALILKIARVRRVLLVTDAIHMERSKIIFADYDLEVIPAPANFYSHDSVEFSDFLPSGEGLRRSDYAMHEWIGIVWYRLRYS